MEVTRQGGAARARLVAVLAVAAVLGLLAGAVALGAGRAIADDGATLTLIAYSTPREAFEAIIPAFGQTAAGAGIEFQTSYGSSGEQSRAVEAGLFADVIALSLAPDIDRLVGTGLVAADWAAGDARGMVTNSVVVLATRAGNPRGIAGWDDLTADGVEVITPNPLTSGGARWNVLAAYGAQLAQGRTDDEAIAYLGDLFANVAVQDKSARESLQTFLGGKGDVLLAYENEVITAQQAGAEIEYVVPPQTILIENPIAIAAESEHPEAAAAFVAYLRSPAAQRVFAEKGYRPLDPELRAEFPFYASPTTLFTIDDLGGWATLTSRFFDPDTGVVAMIQRDR